ncbi:putative membrane protein [Sulfurospirillum multivorans DSM 12446]|uniref:Membrane protein n=3 Tax=Sulfurospirillum multivorans TaxID=66821 RepID=A0AA86E2Q3_SULMK|nr:putative membrane protein [Sulfurospirillum multivorans DSM 12446]QEH06462.1 putative membrane protein [Sulfurospirillum multivorans]
MTAKGHMLLASTITFGALTYVKQHYPIYSPSSLVSVVIILSGIIVGSIFPDIDEDESYIGNKLKLFSVVISSLFKHRTFTHYLITPILCLTLTYFFVEPHSYTQLFFYSFSIGILMHDLGDMLTNGGIRGFFFPLFPNTRIALLPSFLRFGTFSLTEYVFIGLILFPSHTYLVLHYFNIIR